MAKDMRAFYYKMTMKELLTLRSKKHNRIVALEGKKALGYLEIKELQREKELVNQINAEIASRVDQIPLFK